MRLLRIRGLRNWLPVLLLLCVVSGLAATVVLRGGDQTAVANLAEHIHNLDFSKALESLPKSTPTLAFLATVLSMIAAFWRGLTAFGVSPSRMLASVSTNARMRDLKVQTGFRQKFAQEFRDVTDALGARSLMIFIDDIDRCSPQNVLTVLEAINFLVTSGGCFIVIGMARDMVERAVGLQFAAVAEEMADDGVDHPTREQRRERRLRFARQYLDKLINIEIPLPAPTDEQARRLLLERKSVEPERSQVITALDWSRGMASRFAPLLFAAASVLAGVWLGNYLAPGPSRGAPSIASAGVPNTGSETPLRTSPQPGDHGRLAQRSKISGAEVDEGRGTFQWRQMAYGDRRRIINRVRRVEVARAAGTRRLRLARVSGSHPRLVRCSPDAAEYTPLSETFHESRTVSCDASDAA